MEPLQERKQVTIGGAKIPKDEIVKSTVTNNMGVSIYQVELKSGVKITYPEQNGSASIYAGFTEFGHNIAGLTLENMDKAQVIGSKEKNDNIQLIGTTNSTIDVTNDCDRNNVDTVISDKESRGNVVMHNDKDIMIDESKNLFNDN
ncbi:MAG: hypothetical protein R3Y28_05815 [Candidatus Gastranaerophilales bacterium]